MRQLFSAILVTVGLASFGCTQPVAEKEESSSAAKAGLTMVKMDATRIEGSFSASADDVVRFQATKLDEKAFTTTLTLHGLTLDATFTKTELGAVWTQDGFASADGAETMMTQADIALIGQFVKAFEAANPGYSHDNGGIGHQFQTAVDYWAAWIPAMELTRTKVDEADRANSLCARAKCWTGNAWTLDGDCQSYDWYDYTGHDCGSTWMGGSNCNGDPTQGGGRNKCSSVVQLGNHRPYDATWTGSTLYWSTNGWTTSNFNHALGYEIGECYGRYGNGCGDGKSYNDTSLSHDQCVRNGHNIASSWCSDELADTTNNTGECL